jgi:hypothetical protein
MSKQKRQALQSLNETNTPFVPTKTERVFKNVANLSLRGSTFDAKHLDKFLNSAYGEQSFNPDRVEQAHFNQMTVSEQTKTLEASVQRHRSVHSNLPSYLVNSSAIKPSTIFLSPDRENVKFTAFIDLMDGPSGL